MSLSGILSFIGVAVMLTLAPGPDIVFVITQSISQGRRAGIATALGLCTGLVVHTTAAALGLSALIHQSAVAFNLLKYAGAAYLFFLACKALLEKEEVQSGKPLKNQDSVSLYKRGILMNVLNPKVGLFFLALLPQFVDTKASDVPLQMIFLGVLFILQAIAVFSIVATFAGLFGEKILGRPKVARYINRVKAGVFALIGLKLALTE